MGPVWGIALCQILSPRVRVVRGCKYGYTQSLGRSNAGVGEVCCGARGRPRAWRSSAACLRAAAAQQSRSPQRKRGERASVAGWKQCRPSRFPWLGKLTNSLDPRRPAPFRTRFPGSGSARRGQRCTVLEPMHGVSVRERQSCLGWGSAGGDTLRPAGDWLGVRNEGLRSARWPHMFFFWVVIW
jgi:hypothetical protein